jgi:hypothetical protein
MREKKINFSIKTRMDTKINIEINKSTKNKANKYQELQV